MNEPKPVIAMPDVSRARSEFPQRMPATPENPMQMVALAVAQGADIAKLEKLLDLQQRWEKEEARKAFNRAFSAFKSEAVKIIKRTEVKDGPLKGKFHANLFDVVDGTTPYLSKHELAISWRLSKDEPQWMEVTCTLRHAMGHSESVSMGGAPDTGPGRNAIQARGSTKSYLERYTATAILGLAAQDADDDGAGGPPQKQQEAPPDGYDQWHADMTALADEGLARLTGSWSKASAEFRRYVVKYDEPWWLALKKRAAKVVV